MENRLAEVVDKTVIMEVDAELSLCSCESDVVDETCSLDGDDTRGDCGVDTKERYLEILEFTHFVSFFSFDKIGENHKEKVLVNKVTVVVALDLDTRNTKNPDNESE